MKGISGKKDRNSEMSKRISISSRMVVDKRGGFGLGSKK